MDYAKAIENHITIEESEDIDIQKFLAAANNLAIRMLENKEAYNVKGDPTLEELTSLILNLEIEQYRLNLLSDSLIEYDDEIVSIECLDDEIPMIDIRVSGSNLFYANNILTKNSSGPIMTCDFALGIIRTPELDEMNQLILKQLASRYGDPSMLKRFVVGVDKSRMKMYNVDISAQQGLSNDVDSSSKGTNKPAAPGRYTKTKKSNIDSDEWSFDE
jgi:hypothetical protein